MMKDVMTKLNVEKFLEQKDWLETLLPHNELAAGLYDLMNQIQFAAETEYHMNFLCKTDEVTELCPHCDREVTLKWDISKDGLETFCPYCGEKMMLCSYCPATYNERPCDYSNGSCFYSTQCSETSKEDDTKNTAEQLANALVDFAKDFDPYEYMDILEEDMPHAIKVNLEKKRTQPYISFLKEIVNDRCEYSQEALLLIKQLETFSNK